MITSEPSESLKQKLQRALKSKAVMTERSRQLEQQVDDFRKREDSMNHIASELLERQRELNFMLHRASSVLHQLQDTNLALSTEFTHIVKELPAPESEQWDETVNRVNDLFKKTHELAGDLQDEIFRTTQKPEIPRIETPEPPAASAAPAVEAAPEAAAPVVEEETAPEPEAIHEAEVIAEPEAIIEPEIVHEAEISEEIPHTAEVVARVAEPAITDEAVTTDKPADAVEPVAIVESEPTAEPEAETPKPTITIDELFARVDSMGLGNADDEEMSANRPKRGFFAKLMGRGSEDE